MTRMMCERLGPQIAATTIMSGTSGIAKKESVIRISTVSVTPPKYPARMPTAPPTRIATSVAANPTVSEIRAPQISRLRTSVPPSSSPSGANTPGVPNGGPIRSWMP